jgi:hypothetical protein
VSIEEEYPRALIESTKDVIGPEEEEEDYFSSAVGISAMTALLPKGARLYYKGTQVNRTRLRRLAMEWQGGKWKP